MEIDEVLHELKDWGRYQTIAFILITIAGTWFPAWQIFSGAFILAKPTDYHCNPAPETFANESLLMTNTTDDEFGVPSYDHCLMYDGENGTETTECSNGWQYYTTYPEESTAIIEMDLVCSRKFLAATAQSIYFAGVLVGAFSAGQLSDLFGRKTLFILSLLGEGVCGLVLAFMGKYYAFVFVWFLVGMFENGINIVQYVLVMEMFTPEKRTWAGCMNNISWGLGVTLLGPIAWLLKDWRYMQIAISIPCFIGVIYFKVIFESVRWLMARGRENDAKTVIEKIAKFNKVSVPPLNTKHKQSQHIALSDIKQNGDAEKKTDDAVNDVTIATEETATFPSLTVLSLFKKNRLFLNSINMFYQWLMCSLVYYGMSLYSSNLAGDKYLNFFLLGLVEIPAYAAITFTLVKWGRRSTLIVANIIAAVACIITAYIPAETVNGTNLQLAIVAFAMMGKLGITCSFGTVFIYSTEIFPTYMRNVGFGLCSFWSRVGGILAPFVNYLNEVYGPAPLLIFAISSFIGGALAFFLPETLNRRLPETLEEAISLHKAKPISGAQPTKYKPGVIGEHNTGVET